MFRVIVKCLALFAFALPCSASQLWISVPDDSEISFVASYDEIAFNGQFTRFNSEFKLNSADISQSQLTSIIDVTTVDTQSRDRDQALAEHDWFHFNAYPQANFSSTSIKLLNPETLEVTGILTIRDVQKEVTFLMSWEMTDNNMRKAQAKVILDRRDYNIGIGEWLDDDTIGFKVEVLFSINYKLSD